MRGVSPTQVSAMTKAPAHLEKTDAGACRRCGTCCRKGGPTLHIEDRPVVEEGIIPLKALVTFRRGEPVHDQFQGKMVFLTSEIIKIRGKGGDWTCFFFNAADRSCTIYDHRPLECHRLKCWNTDDLKQVYDKDRITRSDLVASVADLAALIALHDRRCDFTVFSRLADGLVRFRTSGAHQALGRMVRLDEETRRLTVAKGGLDPLINDFLFGRPLANALKHMGLGL